MTMQIFNEYVHEHAKHRIGDGWYVTYEPTDHAPSHRSFLGLIMPDRDDNIHYRFEIVEEPQQTRRDNRVNSLRRLSFDTDKIDRGFIWGDGVIEMTWKEDPGEHFLCLSYRTRESDPTYRDQNKNWLQEGF